MGRAGRRENRLCSCGERHHFAHLCPFYHCFEGTHTYIRAPILPQVVLLLIGTKTVREALLPFLPAFLPLFLLRNGNSTSTTGAHRHLSMAGEEEEEVAFVGVVGGGVGGFLRTIGVEEEGGEGGGGLHLIILASRRRACRRLNFTMRGGGREGGKRSGTLLPLR